MNILKGHKKALVIGAGSGADIVSALLIVSRLRAHNKKIIIDLAGFLTPWSLHSFDGVLEKPLNEFKKGTGKKFLIKEENKSLPFFEKLLPKLNKNQSLGFRKIYLLSLQYGTKLLKEKIQKIVDKEKYDLIIAVDIGGDILARKKDLSFIITPLVDFSCLEIIQSTKTNAKKYLAVISPGVDGELPAPILKNIIKTYSNKNMLYDQEIFNKDDIYNKVFLDTVKSINKYQNLGHTTEIIKQIIKGTVKYQQLYIKKILIGSNSWLVKYPVRLDREMVNKIYYFKLDDIYKANDLKISYTSIFGAYKLFKKLGVGGTEVDLKYVAGEVNNGHYNKEKFICNIFNRASSKQKGKITKYISKYLDKNIVY